MRSLTSSVAQRTTYLEGGQDLETWTRPTSYVRTKFPDFVAAMVTKLKRLFPVMGRRRIAEARAGGHAAFAAKGPFGLP